ncbi:MAG TPA: hypothetical protein VL285_01040 [Bryobacteraceae bacterium]|nr:hypothetical protein [Bryobacteraceae bacterium]
MTHRVGADEASRHQVSPALPTPEGRTLYSGRGSARHVTDTD